MDSSQLSDQTPAEAAPPAADMEASVMLPDSTGPQLPDSIVDDQEGGFYGDGDNGVDISNDVHLLRQVSICEEAEHISFLPPALSVCLGLVTALALIGVCDRLHLLT